MRLAIISDIHANAPALKAVLADIKAQHISTIWSLGDLVGYAPFPNEAIDIFRREKIKGIIGNYDLKVLNFEKNKKDWKGKKDPEKFFSFSWTDRNITPATRAYLKKLPENLKLSFAGKTWLLVHGSPENNEEALTAQTPEERFLELAGQVKADIVLCGHSHRAFAKAVSRLWFINPGSVGRPFDSDPRAAYTIIEIKEGQLNVQNRRIAYPMEETIGKMREQGFPPGLVESILRGKSLDDLKNVSAAEPNSEVLPRILMLAESCRYEKEHSHQVTALALQLFDQMMELHGLGPRERLWLQAAGLLHDIGWIKGRQGHHKTGRDIILEQANFPFPEEGQRIIALLVRYHRRGLPEEAHKYFCDLTGEQKAVVQKLAALLRMADGLDRSHRSLVQELVCAMTPEKIIVKVKSSEPCDWERKTAQEKADLFNVIFGKEILFE